MHNMARGRIFSAGKENAPWSYVTELAGSV